MLSVGCLHLFGVARPGHVAEDGFAFTGGPKRRRRNGRGRPAPGEAHNPAVRCVDSPGGGSMLPVRGSRTSSLSFHRLSSSVLSPVEGRSGGEVGKECRLGR
jgi:hypothetical protein